MPTDSPADRGFGSTRSGEPGRADAPGAGDRAGSTGAGPAGQIDKPSMLPAISVPKGGGAIRGIGEKFSVSAPTGTASLTVPLPVSPGRGGFEPQVDLSYDTGQGNGPFGLGFALSVPTITRKSDQGLPRYYDIEESDEYLLSGAEDLVPNRVPDGTTGKMKLDVLDRADRLVQQYRPRAEALFARIERHTLKTDGSVHWEVTTKDNVTHVYGQSPATQIADPRDPARVFSWLLEQSRDDRGNIIQYVYKAEDGDGVDASRLSERSRFDRSTGVPVFAATAQRYLKRILYANFTPKQPDDFLFEMVFDYGDHLGGDAPTPVDDGHWPVRIDPFSTYRAGFEVRTYRLCERVLMFHRLSDDRSPVLVRSTDLKYKPGLAFTYLIEVKQRGYIFDTLGNLTGPPLELPKLDLGYIEPSLHDELGVLPPESLEGLAGGIDGAAKQWVDLDGEGIPGVLVDSDRAWYYKSNAGGGQLSPPIALRTLPSPSSLEGGVQQLQDLAGDGQMDLVTYTDPIPGFASRTPDGGFEPLRSFPALPTIDWKDPNLRFIDVDGDGLADALIAEDDAFVWFRSLAKDGFEQAQRVLHPRDEDRGAAVVFADPEQSVQLADMSGDGLVDIVRVRNGEVCYWPNLGYGRFGAKVTLESSPRFAGVEEFDARRIRFGDVDGSGTNDIFYLGTTGVTLYYNQSGNALSAATPITSLPAMDSAGQVSVVDLLGTGTVSLVWSSPLPRDAQRPIMYVDLMGGVKPHLMKSIVNNMGSTTLLTYAPSTKFYLADKAAGTPWITRLAFPVHVVEKMELLDAISNSRLTSTYSYHHGFFDGVEREFRGFGRVEQTDAEAFTLGPDTSELQPPTLTKSWFHTGAWLEKETLEKAFAREYFQQGPAPLLLPDTILTGDMTIQDEREAARALRGRMLHQEVYALDAQVVGAEKAGAPFVVTEQSSEVRLLQTSKGWRHGIFFAFSRETIAIHTERNPVDPRVTHDFTLDIDDFGNVTRRATITYGRSGASVQPEQQRAWATMAEMSYINNPGASGDPTEFYRLGIPYETISYELTGLTGLPLYTRDALEAAIAANVTANDVAYDVPLAASTPGRRMLDRKQQLYYDNDPTTGAIFGAAAPQQTGSLALPFESYQLALTAGLVNELVAQSTGLTTVPFDPALLGFNGDYTVPQGHYVQRPGDSGYWTTGGRVEFDAAAFYQPSVLTDPFGFEQSVAFDQFNLLIERTQDPLGNIIQAQNDYRVLAPSLVTDPNLNRVAIAFDALGMVIKTAIMGKTTENFGDTLDNPSVTLEYHPLNWQTAGLPVFVRAVTRETHGASPPPRFQETFTYSDGFGRVVMTKIQAEPDPATPSVPRWVGTGRTVFNNKGNPVKQYEPFFSPTSDFESEATVVQAGVTPIIHYDALDRVVRTELPNGTESRVEFDAWQQIASDPNDTVIGTTWWSTRGSPTVTDPEPTDPEERAAWLAVRHAETPKVTQIDALGRTFLVTEQNRLYVEDGTSFTDAFFETRTVLDVEGNALAIIDPRQAQRSKDDPAHPPPVQALVQRFDVLSRAQRSESKDGGVRLMVADVAGKPFFRWDSRSQIFRHRYDQLQRPSHLFVQKTAAEGSGVPGETPEPLTDRLLIRTIYGEALDPPGPAPTATPASAAQALNLRGQPYLLYDCAGKAKNNQFDFKGNLLSSTRRLAQNFQVEPNWSAITEVTTPAAAETAADTLLEAPISAPAPSFTVFTVLTTYDALNRVTSQTTPDLSVTVPTYNEAGLLERLSVAVRGAAPATVISNVDYNARGDRVRYDYADPVVGTATTCSVVYQYDPFTFRLTHVTTTRLANNTVTPVVSAATLQALLYTYDPVGNVVEADDGADAFPIFSGTTPVTGNLFYRYDSVYRLLGATGREHPGQQPLSTQPRGNFDIPVAAVPHPNDMTALLRYLEQYSYDEVGNITQLQHTTTQANGMPGQANTIWTRNYVYEAATNRLASNNEFDDAGSPSTATFTYTGNGAMKRMAHLPVIEWDYADRMRHATKSSGGGGDVFCTYDGAGQRVRKAFVTGTLAERIYIGGWETHRSHSGTTSASSVTEERETLHVMDGEYRVAMVETKIIGSGGSGPFWRFQLDNLLGSAVMDLDPEGRVIAYEEYHPFGSSAFRSSDSGTEVSPRRYRFTGKEKDEETGLYYYGARYYAPWLGRWISSDPAVLAEPGAVDLASYSYVRNNPINYIDDSGFREKKPSKSGGAAPSRAPTPAPAPGASPRAPPVPGSPASFAISANAIDILILKVKYGSNLPPTVPPPGARSSKSPREIIEKQILPETASSIIPDLQTGGFTKRDASAGFRPEFKDPYPESSNQTGHFLTAVRHSLVGVDPRVEKLIREKTGDTTTPTGPEFALRLDIGHELKADPGPAGLLGPIANKLNPFGSPAPDPFSEQYLMSTAADVKTFQTALKNLSSDPEATLDLVRLAKDLYSISSRIPKPPSSGNSEQDLLLTAVGWKFGELLKAGKFKDSEQAARWLARNLKGGPPAPGKGPPPGQHAPAKQERKKH
jgi:RHS repeat-associated protein